MEKLTFNFETYEVPMDLLLSLIKKNEMSIFDIKIHIIFKQYMEYLEMMEKLDIEVAGEFITLAAELMLIKSQMLLPRSDEEETPLKKLQMAVMEYAKAKHAAEYLREQWADNSGAVAREPQEPEVGLPLHYELNVLERAEQMFKGIDGNVLDEVSVTSEDTPFEGQRPVGIPEHLGIVVAFKHEGIAV